MPRPVDSVEHDEPAQLTSLTETGPGSLPVSVVPWTLLLARRRVASRAQGHNRYQVIALIFVLGAMFAVNLTVTLVAVVVPTIASDLGAADSTVVWAVTGPILAAAVLGPTFGKLGDQRGHRLMFLIGLLINAIFTMLVALSWNGLSFVTFRLLAAVGAAAIGPSALAFINRLFDPHDRATALGFWSFVGAGSPVLGLIVGGPVVERFGWQIVFWVQAPLVVIAFVAAALVLPETNRRERERFDIAGAVTLAGSVAAGLIAVTRAGTDGLSLSVGVLALGAVAGLGLFTRIEQRSDQPLIPPRYWRMRGFVVPTGVLTLLFAAYMGSFVMIPLMLQSSAYGITAAQTGLVIVCRPLMFAFTGPVAGYLAPRLGDRVLAGFGTFCVASSMLILSTFRPGQSLLIVAVALAIAGLGAGASAPVLTARVANTVAADDLGVAGAAQQMVQQFGLVVGIQALLALQASLFMNAGGAGDSALVDSYSVAFQVAMGIALCGFALTLALRRLPKGRDRMQPI